MAVALAGALASACGTVPTWPRDLAWERWQRCAGVSGVTLERVTDDGRIEVGTTSAGARARWEACVFEAHRAQLRRTPDVAPAPSGLTPIADWKGVRCGSAQPVQSPWDEEVAHVFQQLLAVASAETSREGSVVVGTDLGGGVGGRLCASPRRFTVMVSAAHLHVMRDWPARRLVLARILAHEIAHIVLWHVDRTLVDGVERLEAEREADELAAFYIERAGLVCRAWVDHIGRPVGTPAWGSHDAERAAITRVCELARRGERPPRRLTIERTSS